MTLPVHLTKPIDWRDIRLCAGDGDMTLTDVLNAANAIMKRRVENIDIRIRQLVASGDRIGTHGVGCHTWGPRHYDCALREIERLGAVPRGGA